jgi:hypothetical protein
LRGMEVVVRHASHHARCRFPSHPRPTGVAAAARAVRRWGAAARARRQRAAGYRHLPGCLLLHRARCARSSRRAGGGDPLPPQLAHPITDRAARTRSLARSSTGWSRKERRTGRNPLRTRSRLLGTDQGAVGAVHELAGRGDPDRAEAPPTRPPTARRGPGRRPPGGAVGASACAQAGCACRAPRRLGAGPPGTGGGRAPCRPGRRRRGHGVRTASGDRSPAARRGHQPDRR